MNERWTYTVIADQPGGTPIEMRVTLEDRDTGTKATVQVAVSGSQTTVDDKPRDYEAPEWKAKQIFSEGGVADVEAYLEALQNHLRSAIASA